MSHFGLNIFSTFKVALISAAIIIPVLVLFGGFLIMKPDANVMFHWVMDMNFLKQAGDASSAAILGYNRSKLRCDDSIYCHFQWPYKLLEQVGVKDVITIEPIVNLFVFLILFRVATFYIINNRLKS